MNDDKYNGWTNYETWAVSLWIGNDQGSYEYWRERASECLPDNRDDAVHNLASQLENEIEDMSPLADADASLYSDLLSSALNEVNWYEIAEGMVDEAIEEAA